MSEGGFGGLGIGNPGSYGGQQSVGAPGFGGGYSEGYSIFDRFKNNVVSNAPKTIATVIASFLTGSIPLSLAIGKLVQNGLQSEFAQGLLSDIKSGSITPNQAITKATGQINTGRPSTTTQPTTQANFLDRMTQGSVLGPDKLDAENTISGWKSGSGRSLWEDSTAQSFLNLPEKQSLLSTSGFSSGSLGTGLIKSKATTNEGGNMQTPYTLTMEDLTKDPRFSMLKNANEQQFGLARDNIISGMPAGGQLLDRLADLETDRAGAMVSGLGGLSQDIADKTYGKELAELGADVSLANTATSTNTAQNIASQQIDAQEEMYMNQLYTMMGMAMAEK